MGKAASLENSASFRERKKLGKSQAPRAIGENSGEHGIRHEESLQRGRVGVMDFTYMKRQPGAPLGSDAE